MFLAWYWPQKHLQFVHAFLSCGNVVICLFLCCLWVLIFCSCRQKCLDSHMPWTARMTKQNAEYLIESASRFAKKQVRVQRGCRQRYCTKMHKEPLKTFSPLPFPIFVYSLFLFLAVLAWVVSSCARQEGLSCPSLMVSAWLGKPGKQSAVWIVWNSTKIFATLRYSPP